MTVLQRLKRGGLMRILSIEPTVFFVRQGDGLRRRVSVAIESASAAEAVLRVSGNRLFDAAALAAIKRFVPKEGGSARLPIPDDREAVSIRRRGLRIKLDGSQL